MKEQTIQRFLVAAPQRTCAKVEAILSEIGIAPDAVCTTGEEVLRQAEGAHVLVLTAWKLADMTGEELTKQLGEKAQVMMIVPGDYEHAQEAGSGALLLKNPISQDALGQAIRTMQHCQAIMIRLEERAGKLEKQLEERKVIDKAKGRLMDELGLTEKQAHYHIQKKSMDSGRRIADVARGILENGIDTQE